MSKESDSLIYYSCLPWIELTAITNERDRNAPDAADDSIPRLAWESILKRTAEKN
jgi:chloramphenicol O-acetyltransferase type A